MNRCVPTTVTHQYAEAESSRRAIPATEGDSHIRSEPRALWQLPGTYRDLASPFPDDVTRWTILPMVRQNLSPFSRSVLLEAQMTIVAESPSSTPMSSWWLRED